MRENPDRAQQLLREAGKFDPQDIKDSWKHHGWIAAVPDDMLDVLVRQEQWLAEQSDREPRSREVLAGLIDTSAYEEAVALGPQAARE